MYVALVGGSGQAGSRILAELKARGHRVRMIGRTAPAGEGQEWLVDDLSDPAKTAEAIRGTDAVVSAYAPSQGNTDALVGACETLAEAVARSGVGRLLVVGGAGLLEVAPGVTLIASGKLPEAWMGIARSHEKALAALRAAAEAKAVNWTYLAPAAFFEPGERKGHYRFGGEQLVVDEQGEQLVVDERGESRVSMEDYAIAMVDELENGAHARAVCSVGW